MMSGGFLMFPKIVSKTGICFTKASIYLTGMEFLCKHRLSDSVVAPEDWKLNPWQELEPSTTETEIHLCKSLKELIFNCQFLEIIKSIY